ncbi:ABC transporter permease subunit [Gynuella sp.]|uniref:ABC transporter permease subunit n=1 Tax=Gynuella sp. TaxID=2969146 RepID=UPI003D1409D5
MKRFDLSRLLPGGRWWIISVPYLWLLVFFMLPFIFVLKIAFSEADIAIPPYTSMFEWAEDTLSIHISFSNFIWLGSDQLYLIAYWNSIKMAFFSTIFCLLLGYPMAYAIARAPARTQAIWLLLILLPSWTSFLIRVYAWMGLLKSNGLINNFLLWTGIIQEPLQMMNTNFAVYIGIVYSYLPFMVLPLYANLVKHDHTLLEAASDLGAKAWVSFWRITLPLSKNGVVAGSMLVFIPVVGEFVIPELLGGADSLMIGRILWQEFFNNRDWPVASALAVIMLLILLAPIALFHRYQNKESADEFS